MYQNGTMVTVVQHCSACGVESFKWRSQPYVFGRYPAGNLLLSFGILMAGASVSKIILVFKHMGLAVYTSRTFFYHQNKFIFPTILNHWESYQAKLIESLRTITDTVWCGDGRFDSMGHSAKYGVYTMFCTTIMKIVHFDLLQVSMKYIAFVEGNCMLPPSKATVFPHKCHNELSVVSCFGRMQKRYKCHCCLTTLQEN